MGGTCSKNGGRWLILRWILEIGWGDVDWIGLTQDRDKWRALVNVVKSYLLRHVVNSLSVSLFISLNCFL
jgi:hypothetical protein